MAISIHCMTGAALTGISLSLAEQVWLSQKQEPIIGLIDSHIPCNVTKMPENASLVLCSMDAVGTMKLLSIEQPFALCMTCVTVVPQAKSLLTFVEAISEKTLRSTVAQLQLVAVVNLLHLAWHCLPLLLLGYQSTKCIVNTVLTPKYLILNIMSKA